MLKRTLALFAAGLWAGHFAFAADDGALATEEDVEITFRSDVSLVRVDVQVLESNSAVTGLNPEDFGLRDNGKPVAIRNFAREEMPIDVLFLLDVSGSMQPHIRSVADASRQALNVMSQNDRVAVMVFDRSTRIRAPFRPAGDAYRDLQRVLDQESFNGGTDVTGALKDAINYISRQGRKEGRRAIIIVTDDMTEFQADVPGIGRLLAKDDIVLSALIAPDAMGNRVGFPGGGGRRRGGGTIGTGWPGGGGIGFPGGWPGGGGGSPWPGGGGGGRRLPGGVVIGGAGGPTLAGSAEIARQSGGDSFDVDEARALEETLERLRQRYALFFHAPAGSREGQERSIEVSLSAEAKRRHPYAELRYRDSYIATDVVDDGSAGIEEPVSVSSSDSPATTSTRSSEPADDRPRFKRRPAISEPGSNGPNPNVGGVWRPAEPEELPSSSRTPVQSAPTPEPTKTGGWRKATPADTQ